MRTIMMDRKYQEWTAEEAIADCALFIAETIAHFGEQ